MKPKLRITDALAWLAIGASASGVADVSQDAARAAHGGRLGAVLAAHATAWVSVDAAWRRASVAPQANVAVLAKRSAPAEWGGRIKLNFSVVCESDCFCWQGYQDGENDVRVANRPVWAVHRVSAVADQLHAMVQRGLVGAAVVHTRVVCVCVCVDRRSVHG